MDLNAELPALPATRKKKKAYWVILRPVLFVLVPMLIVLHTVPGPKGTPFMSLNDWLPSEQLVNTFKGWIGEIPIENNPYSTEHTIYKWQNAEGIWEFSKEQPVNISDFQVIVIDTETDMMIVDLSPEDNATPSQPVIPVSFDEAVQIINQAEANIHERDEALNQL